MGSVRRDSLNRYLGYLGLNVLVSALTVTIVLLIWEARKPDSPPATPTPTVDVLAAVASAVPTITSTVAPTPTTPTYTVQPGDTLLDIATRLDVDMGALMAANRITDPDSLSPGQVLIIPVGEAALPPAATATPRPESLQTVTPNPDAQAPRVEIRGVSGAGILESETVLLLNGGGDARMAGWMLDDGQGHRYTFPIFTLHNGAVSVHTRSGTDTVIDLYWGLDEAVWLPGKVITLRDAADQVHSTFTIPGG